MSPVLAPNTPDELEAVLSDDKKFTDLMKSPADFKAFIGRYVDEAKARHGAVLEEQMRDQAQIAIADLLKDSEGELRGRLDFSDNGRPKIDGYDPDTPGAVIDKEFASQRDFILSVLPDRYRSAENRAKWDRIRNDYSTVDPATGGYLVPETVRSEIMMRSLATSIVMPRAMVIPMDTPTVALPAVDETTQNGSVYGGITSDWAAEGEAFTESGNAQFRRVVLRANKHGVFLQAPSELATDSPRALATILNQMVPSAMAHFTDIEHLRGAGTGRPLGVLHTTNTGLIVVAKETSQAASTVVLQNLSKMYARMLPDSIDNAVWVVAHDVFPQLVELALSVGTGGSAVWLNNAVEGPPIMIFGRPVIRTGRTYSLGSQGDVAFVDLSQYAIGDLQRMRVETSIHYAFNQDIISYRFIERKDGRPLVQSALTLANGSTSTVSPYVTLAVRS